MNNFRYNYVIALAIAVAAGAMGSNSMLLEPPYRRVFVTAVLLFAGIVALPLPKRRWGDSNVLGRFLRVLWWLGFSVFLTTAAVYGVAGYRSKMAQKTIKQELQLEPHSPPLGGTGTPVKPVSEIDRFLEAYANTSDSGKSDKPRWAFVVSDDRRSDLPEVDSVLRAAIERAGYRSVHLFRPMLVRDGKLNEVYAADPVLLRRLSPFCDGIIVGTAKSRQIPDLGIQGMYTVELELHVRVLSPASGVVQREFSVLQRGAGFTVEEAEMIARQHAAQTLEKQIDGALAE